MPVTLDPEHLRALWGGIVLLAVLLALALWRLRHATRPLPQDQDQDRPAPSLLARAAKTSGLPPALAYPIFTLALALLALGLVGAVTVVAATILQTLTQGAAASLGAGALIAALLGAPFILWRSLVAQRTVNIAQESHVTDLIAKAVEQLGAEKTIDRIGRPVTVWTGERSEHVETTLDASTFQLPPRSREISRGNTVEHVPDAKGKFTEADATAITYESWPTEVTRIEWCNTPLLLADDELIATPGDWQAFSETVPNIEVRIGAILALERLARQNLDVHVQIMEILTAYIRENAKAKDAPRLPEPPDYHEEYSSENHEARSQSFKVWEETHTAALADIRPREDIQKALSVIGRRSPEQRTAEAIWQNPDPTARFVFDDPAPDWPRLAKDADPASPLSEFTDRLERWQDRIAAYRGYRIDLRATNLRRADLSGLNLRGARLEGAQMQGASLGGAQMQGASLDRAQMQGASLFAAQMQGAWLEGAQFSDATSLSRASLRDAQVREVDLRSTPCFLAQIAPHFPTLFADASVLLPDDHPRPAHWPTWEMDRQTFNDEYATWRTSPSSYKPPPPPTNPA